MTAHTHIQPAECASSCRERERKGRHCISRSSLDWLAGHGKKQGGFSIPKYPAAAISYVTAMRRPAAAASIMKKTLSFPTDSLSLFSTGTAKKTRLQQGKQGHPHTYIHIYTPRRKVSSGDRSSTLGRSSTLLPFRFRISLFFFSNPRLYRLSNSTLRTGSCALPLFSFLQSSLQHVRPNQPILAWLGWPMPITHSVNFFFCWLVE